MFVCKLITMEHDTIVKHVFLNQLCGLMFQSCNITSGTTCITSDLLSVLFKYNIIEYILRYLYGCQFPGKRAWTTIIKRNIHNYQEYWWKVGLSHKDLCFYIVQNRFNRTKRVSYMLSKRHQIWGNSNM